MTLTTNNIIGNQTSGSLEYQGTLVYLSFKSRGDVSGDASFITNRIALKAETVDISTTRTVPSFPLPFSGAITGESTALAIDLGMATKNINLTGIITEQVISKQADENAGVTNVQMTAYEVAQLLHASVDSSFLQTHQNIGELTILFPSRVGNNYSYHSGVDHTTNVDELPLVPWSWASRKLDQAVTVGATDFPPIATNSEVVNGLNGFIQTFSTNIQGGQPFITFNMTFEVALVPLG